MLKETTWNSWVFHGPSSKTKNNLPESCTSKNQTHLNWDCDIVTWYDCWTCSLPYTGYTGDKTLQTNVAQKDDFPQLVVIQLMGIPQSSPHRSHQSHRNCLQSQVKVPFVSPSTHVQVMNFICFLHHSPLESPFVLVKSPWETTIGITKCQEAGSKSSLQPLGQRYSRWVN